MDRRLITGGAGLALVEDRNQADQQVVLDVLRRRRGVDHQVDHLVLRHLEVGLLATRAAVELGGGVDAQPEPGRIQPHQDRRRRQRHHGQRAQHREAEAHHPGGVAGGQQQSRAEQHGGERSEDLRVQERHGRILRAAAAAALGSPGGRRHTRARSGSSGRGAVW